MKNAVKQSMLSLRSALPRVRGGHDAVAALVLVGAGQHGRERRRLRRLAPAAQPALEVSFQGRAYVQLWLLWYIENYYM